MRKKQGNIEFQNKCNSEEGQAVREFLGMIGDKWTVIIILILFRAPKHRARFSDIQRDANGISKAMLTSTLRSLERDGLIIREIFAEVPPRVEYELTEMGISLFGSLDVLVNWIMSNWGNIKQAREKNQ